MLQLLSDALQIIQSHWILSLLVLLGTLIYIHYLASFGEIQRLGLPGPKPLPILGNVLQMFWDQGQMHKTFDRLVKQYGKVFGIYFLKTPTVVVSDPQMLKTILVKEFNSFHDRPRADFEVPEPSASMLTNLTGERWKNVRSVLSPAFTTGKLKDIMFIMNQAIDTFLEKCKSAAESGETVDIFKWQQGITMEVILSAAFGVQAESQTNPNDPITKYAQQSLKPRPWIMIVAMIPILGKKLTKYFLGGSFNGIQKVSECAIKERKLHGIENSATVDLLHLMLASQDPEKKGYKLTDNEVTAQSMLYLIAGYDTSSITLGLTSYHLAIYPEVQDKVFEEIDTLFPGDEVDYDSLHKTIYLDAVISETLRIYPPAVATSRTVSKTCEIDGVTFKKDMAVIIPIYTLHHDEKYWKDPEVFSPERFLPSNKEFIDPFTYMPFGQGPRNCVGMRFAQLEMKAVLARLLKNFRIERAPELQVPIRLKPRVLMGPADPVYIRLKKRNK